MTVTGDRALEGGHYAAKRPSRCGVLDGIVAFEGSTNWSSSGEGVSIKSDAAKQKLCAD